MIAEDYEAKIEITSQSLDDPVIVDWSSFSVRNHHGQAETSFSVDLRRPINISVGDTITISDAFADAPLVPLVQNKLIEGVGGSVQQFQIRGAGSKLTRRGPVKSTIYVNRGWLKKRCGSYHLYDTGAGPNSIGYSSQVIMQYNPGANPMQYEGVSRMRLMLAELPGREVRDIEFGCVVDDYITRQDIARNIAAMCGYELVTNMPNLPIQKVFAVHSTQTFWDSLVQLFNDWKPIIFTKGTKIHVMDIGVDRQAKDAGNTIALTEDSFTLISWNNEKNNSPVDHILVHGPDAQHALTTRSQMISKRTYSEVNLPGQDITVTTDEKEEDVRQDELEKTLYSSGMADRVVRTLRTVVQRQDQYNTGNMATISENIQTFNSAGDKLSEVDTQYKHAAYNKPVKCITTHYGRIGRVGGGINETSSSGIKQILPVTWDWTKLSEGTMIYRDYYEDIGQVETDFEEFCLCVSLKEKELDEEGNEVIAYDQTQPLWQALQSGILPWEENDEDGNGWQTAWQKYRTEAVRFDKSSSVLYRKSRHQVTYYPFRVAKPSYEDIPLPLSKHNSATHKKWEFFWMDGALYEFTGGIYPTCPDPDGWHPRVDISSPDIIDGDTAYKVAYRQMASSPTIISTAVVETTLPLHNAFVGGTLKLPACTKEIVDYDASGNIVGYRDITIPSKTYWIVGHERITTNAGDVGDAQRQLAVRDRVELKEYF